MWDSIFSRPDVVVPLGGGVIVVVAIVCGTIVKIHRQTTDARLKERMIDRGLSADEIDRILSSENAKLAPSKDGKEDDVYRKPQPSK